KDEEREGDADVNVEAAHARLVRDEIMRLREGGAALADQALVPPRSSAGAEKSCEKEACQPDGAGRDQKRTPPGGARRGRKKTRGGPQWDRPSPHIAKA